MVDGVVEQEVATDIINSNSPTEIMKIGGVNLLNVIDAKAFLDKQDPDVVFNTVNPMLMCSNFGLYWLGAILSHLKTIEYHEKLHYDSGKGGFIEFCKDEYRISRPTVNKYMYTYEVLTQRGIMAKDVMNIGIDSLALIAKHAEAYGDDALQKLLEFARENSTEDLKSHILGDDDNASGANHGEYKIVYFEEDLKTFKDLVEKLQTHYNQADLSKITLQAFSEFAAQNIGYVPSLQNDLQVLLTRHKIDTIEVLKNMMSEIIEKKK